MPSCDCVPFPAPSSPYKLIHLILTATLWDGERYVTRWLVDWWEKARSTAVVRLDYFCLFFYYIIDIILLDDFCISYSFFLIFIYLCILFWLCWVFISVRGPSLVAASGGHSSSQCAGLSLSRPLLLRSTGSRRAGSVVVAHGPSCSAACGISPDQGSNPCPLHRQAGSEPLRHQGNPVYLILLFLLFLISHR